MELVEVVRCFSLLTRCFEFNPWDWKKFSLGDLKAAGTSTGQAELVKFMLIGPGEAVSFTQKNLKKKKFQEILMY